MQEEASLSGGSLPQGRNKQGNVPGQGPLFRGGQSALMLLDTPKYAQHQSKDAFQSRISNYTIGGALNNSIQDSRLRVNKSVEDIHGTMH